MATLDISSLPTSMVKWFAQGYKTNGEQGSLAPQSYKTDSGGGIFGSML